MPTIIPTPTTSLRWHLTEHHQIQTSSINSNVPLYQHPRDSHAKHSANTIINYRPGSLNSSHHIQQNVPQYNLSPRIHTNLSHPPAFRAASSNNSLRETAHASFQPKQYNNYKIRFIPTKSDEINTICQMQNFENSPFELPSGSDDTQFIHSFEMIIKLAK
jgi:hypothetical protein